VRVLVTGAQGMLGSVLLPCLQSEHQVCGVDQKDFDIGEEAAVGRAFLELRPEFVFHLAAFTDVDGCEANPSKAEQINALGTRNVARACAEIGAGLLYVSTDYVFDGRGKRPYREDDCPNPISVYGLTKLRGEARSSTRRAAHNCQVFLALRTVRQEFCCNYSEIGEGGWRSARGFRSAGITDLHTPLGLKAYRTLRHPRVWSLSRDRIWGLQLV